MRTKVNIRKQKIGEGLLYSAIWVAVYLVPIMNAKLMSELHVDFMKVLTAWIKITPFFILFIIHNQLLLPLIMGGRKRRRYLIYISVSVVLICTTFALIDVYEQSNTAVSQPNYNPVELVESGHASLTDLEWYWNIWLCLFMFGVNLGIKLLYKSMQDDEDMEIARRRAVQAEMYYLKHQINPHFFMNTLNNIHALIDIDTEAAKTSVIELSNMMRYVVYDSGADDISLKKDIAFIANYIELMRIRYTDVVDIRFNYPKHLPSNIAVPPLIFIVFVENAFKHGVSYNRPSYIHIDIEYSDSKVTAHIANSLHQGSQKEDGGIGLDNVRKRLDLIYGGQYTLDIASFEAERYEVTLTIPTISPHEIKVSGN